MNRKRMILISLTMGLVAALIVWRQANRNHQNQALAQQDLRVVVTTQPIEKFEPIDPALLKVQEVAPESAPADAIHSLEEVQNCIAARPLPAGTSLQNKDVLDVEDLGLAAEIPPGRRAITVEVDRVANVGGVLKPGRFVDVIATFDSPVAGEGKIAKTVIQRIKVLAVYRRRAAKVEGEATGGEEPDAMLVTLAVTPSEANRLVLADVSGKLRLSMRPLRETEWGEVPSLEATSLRQMLGLPMPTQEQRSPAPSPAAASAPKPRSPVRSTPPPDFHYVPPSVVPPPSLPAPALAPAPVSRELPVPMPDPNLRHVKVIRGTQVETVMVTK